jgi:hypothetical protein
MVNIRQVDPPAEAGATAFFRATFDDGERPEGNLSFSWSFQPGGIKFGREVNLQFDQPGSVLVRVTVDRVRADDSEERVDRATKQITVEEEFTPPDTGGDDGDDDGDDDTGGAGQPYPEPTIGKNEFANGIAPDFFGEEGITSVRRGPTFFDLRAVLDQDGDDEISVGDTVFGVIDQKNVTAFGPNVRRRLERERTIPKTRDPGEKVRLSFRGGDLTTTIELSGEGGPTGPREKPAVPEPKAGDAPTIDIPLPSLQYETFDFVFGLKEIPVGLGLGPDTFEVRLPPFDTYVQSAELGFNFSGLGTFINSVNADIDRLQRKVGNLQAEAGGAVDALTPTDLTRLVNDPASEVRSVIDRVAQAAEDAAKEADRSLRSLRGTIQEEVSGIRATAETAATEVTGLIDRLPNNIPALINEEVQNVREGLLPEAVNATSLNQAIESQVKAVLPVTLDQLQKAVNRVEELGRSEALQSFLENPAGYVLDAVFSEARRRVGEGLGSRIRRLLAALLEAQVSPEAKERLNEAVTDDDA